MPKGTVICDQLKLIKLPYYTYEDQRPVSSSKIADAITLINHPWDAVQLIAPKIDYIWIVGQRYAVGVRHVQVDHSRRNQFSLI